MAYTNDYEYNYVAAKWKFNIHNIYENNYFKIHLHYVIKVKSIAVPLPLNIPTKNVEITIAAINVWNFRLTAPPHWKLLCSVKSQLGR